MLINILKRSIAAGILISLGAVVKLRCENQLAGDVLFSIGLYFICSYGMYLFTGKIGYINKTNWAQYPVIWIGNLLGCIIAMLLIRVADPCYHTAVSTMMEVKLGQSIVTTAVLSFFCGVIMYLAVENSLRQQAHVSKIFGIVIGVTVFLISGFEHSIADMAYSVLYITTATDATECLIFVLCVSVFNALGAITMRWILNPCGRTQE